MPKTQPCGPHSPAKCLLAPGPGAPPALKGPQPSSSRTSRTAWRKVRPGGGSCPPGAEVGGREAGERKGRLTPPPSPEPPPAPGSCSDSHGESSGEPEERDLSGPQAPRGPAQVPAEGVPSGGGGSTPTLGAQTALPQAAGSGTEETAAKAKQSRSEKKARKVGWGLLPGVGGWSDNPARDWGPSHHLPPWGGESHGVGVGAPS